MHDLKHNHQSRRVEHKKFISSSSGIYYRCTYYYNLLKLKFSFLSFLGMFLRFSFFIWLREISNYTKSVGRFDKST